jgi:hypothetical protein
MSFLKIKLVINLEFPDGCYFSNGAVLEEILSDGYVNYTAISHLKDAVKWQSNNELGSKKSRNALVQYHTTWADICDNATWEYTLE